MKKLLLFLTALVLLLSLLACPAGEAPDGTTPGTPVGTPTAAPGKGDQPDAGDTTATTGTTGSESGENQPSGDPVYTVNVRDAKGNAAENVVVRLTGGEINKIALCEGGIAKFTLPAGEYTVTVEAVEGEFYYEPLTLTPENREGEVTIYTKLTEYEKVSAYNKEGRLNDNISAYTLEEGVSYYRLKVNARAYFIFTPARGGIYRISVKTTVPYELGCYGNPLSALRNSTVEQTEEGIFLEIPTSGVGGSFLIGITPDSAKASDALITVERTGEAPVTEFDSPWVELEPQKTPADCFLSYGNYTVTLSNLDITDKNLTVVLGEDGYYHLGTADGALVYVRLGTASPYLDSFADICAVTRMCAYFYNEDGTFDRRESYNLLFEAYLAAADPATGLYPLTEELAYAIKASGEASGWWKTGETCIFGTTAFDPSVAWLFACVTVTAEEKSASATLTLGESGRLLLSAGDTVTCDASLFAGKTLTISVPAGESVTVTLNGTTYTSDENGKITLTVPETATFTLTYTGKTTAEIRYTIA